MPKQGCWRPPPPLSTHAMHPPPRTWSCGHCCGGRAACPACHPAPVQRRPGAVSEATRGRTAGAGSCSMGAAAARPPACPLPAHLQARIQHLDPGLQLQVLTHALVQHLELVGLRPASAGGLHHQRARGEDPPPTHTHTRTCMQWGTPGEPAVLASTQPRLLQAASPAARCAAARRLPPLALTHQQSAATNTSLHSAPTKTTRACP